MEIFELISHLRRERGLTQTQLGELAGCSLSTIQVAESPVSSRERKLSRSNALRVFRALNALSRLRDDHAFAYLDHFELSRSLAAAPLPPSAQAPRASSNNLQAVSDQIGEAMRCLGELIQLVGPARAVQEIRDRIADLRAQGVTPAADPTFTVVHPPRPSSVPGAIEQQIVTYTKPKTPAAIKRAGKPPKQKPGP